MTGLPVFVVAFEGSGWKLLDSDGRWTLVEIHNDMRGDGDDLRSETVRASFDGILALERVSRLLALSVPIQVREDYRTALLAFVERTAASLEPGCDLRTPSRRREVTQRGEVPRSCRQ